MSDAGSVAEVITASLATPSLSLLAPTVVSAFLLGLSGAAHCVGMCGGIVASLASREGRLPAGQAVIAFTHPHADRAVGVHRSSAGSAMLTPLLYNLGRISSYSIAGALAGTAGSAAWLSSTLLPLQQAAFVIASLMMILIGLHLAGLPVLSRWFERVGARVWKFVEPAARASLRRPGMGGTFLAGAAWGWVPCGLVYSALTAALVSASAAAGAAIALAFGLGTLPALSALGWAAGRGLARARTSRLLRVMGVLIVAWGVAGLLHLDPLAHLQPFGDACVSGFR